MKILPEVYTKPLEFLVHCSLNVTSSVLEGQIHVAASLQRNVLAVSLLALKPSTCLQSGCTFLAGDAAHQFPPAGGFGMNTGVLMAGNTYCVSPSKAFEITANKNMHSKLS